MTDGKSLSIIGLKEIIGNFTPIYIIITLILILGDKLEEINFVYFIFVAGIIAIAVTAVKQNILNMILFKWKIKNQHTWNKINKLIEEENNIDTDKAKSELRQEYGRHIDSSFEQFWEKRDKAELENSRFLDIKEARLLLFFYLSLAFFFITIFNIFQFLTGIEILSLIYNIDYRNFTLLTGSLTILTILFFKGFLYERKGYIKALQEVIPIFATNTPDYSESAIDDLRERLRFYKSEQNDGTITQAIYDKFERECNYQIEKIQEINVKAKWINKKVNEATNISELKLQEISKEISHSLSRLSAKGSFIPSLLFGLTMATFVIMLFLSPTLTNNEAPINTQWYGTAPPPSSSYYLPKVSPYDPIQISVVFIAISLGIAFLTRIFLRKIAVYI